MRKLHEVAAHETFVASGEYRTYRNGDLLPVREQWTIHELKGGARLFRVDEDGREMDGLSILSESLVSPDGTLERFNVRSFNSHQGETAPFQADYTFNPDYVQIGRKSATGERQYDEFPLLEGAGVYIKQMLYMSLVIPVVLNNNGKLHVFAPALFADDDNQLQKLIVKSADPFIEPLSIGRRTIDAHKYQIADDVFYWLDEHHIPVKRTYTHDGSHYDVLVANYAHR